MKKPKEIDCEKLIGSMLLAGYHDFSFTCLDGESINIYKAIIQLLAENKELKKELNRRKSEKNYGG